ncbi:secreted protein [Moniliophthora roreri MCA 2997]|uniref:Secreted protein n=1 Tax=Moniliophthora roreri (strain MCA 2997) TaxID=1381753 RepID=V2XE56_MONRO|nr:secreted protein [Moniliophthora roreri MCA 2997]KAI3609507.1 secreted protein [Moniliophthora roreri]
MRINTFLFTVIFGTTLIDIVVAQDSGLPCILKCSNDNLSAGPCSSIQDLQCICTNQSYQDAVKKCLQEKCASADLQSAMGLQSQSCGSLKPSEQQNTPEQNTPPPPEQKKPEDQTPPPPEQKKPEDQTPPPPEQKKPEDNKAPPPPPPEQKNPPEQNPSGGSSDCVTQCAQEALTSSACKDITDLKCICTDDAYRKGFMACLNKNDKCTSGSILNALTLQKTNCGPFMKPEPQVGARPVPGA